MNENQKKSKRDVLDVLIVRVGEIKAEQNRLAKKMENIMALMKLLQETPDGDWGLDDLDMETPVDIDDDEDDDPEVLEFDGETYRVGDTVELWNCVKKRWKGTGKLEKFCEQMAKITVNGKVTRRKFGNFRHPGAPP